MSHKAKSVLLSQLITILMHRVFARLSWLVCFSRRLFADPVKSRLSQWCQQRAPNGRHGLGILPIASEMSLSPSGLIQAQCGYFLTSQLLQTVYTGLFYHLPPPPPSYAVNEIHAHLKKIVSKCLKSRQQPVIRLAMFQLVNKCINAV